MSTKYGKRVLAAMGYAGFTQQELADRLGIEQPSLNYIIHKTKESKYNAQIAQECGVMDRWLAFNIGTMNGDSTHDCALPFPPKAATLYLSPSVVAKEFANEVLKQSNSKTLSDRQILAASELLFKGKKKHVAPTVQPRNQTNSPSDDQRITDGYGTANKKSKDRETDDNLE